VIIAGIDYSMTCPCICTGPFLKTFRFKDFIFNFLTGKEKRVGKWLGKQIIGTQHAAYSSPEQRFNNIASWAINIVNSADFVVLEGYAMGAKGLVFHIGENTGLLKHNLWLFQKRFVVVAPKTIKKFATGSGNARKEQMYESFLAETKVDLLALFEQTKVNSPVNDIVDAFYMNKYAHHLVTETKCIQTAGSVH
jgi:Holliday junction resolvasome RuvABC endonuclease subunit